MMRMLPASYLTHTEAPMSDTSPGMMHSLLYFIAGVLLGALIPSVHVEKNGEGKCVHSSTSRWSCICNWFWKAFSALFCEQQQLALSEHTDDDANLESAEEPEAHMTPQVTTLSELGSKPIAAMHSPDRQLSNTSWYVGIDDAYHTWQRVLDQDRGDEHGWTHMNKDKQTFGVFRYTAHRRPLASGICEYRTVTTCCGTSPMELMEFLLDDEARRHWEAFLQTASILEQGNWQDHKEQVVRWTRRFPFHFLTDREYIIARKVWAVSKSGALVPLSEAEPGASLVAVTKSLGAHPAAPISHSLVRTSDFDSCWVCRPVPHPFYAAGNATASEVVLLHSENIHIPEYLARTAISVGMSKFVNELVGGLARYKQDRASRGVQPDMPDPHGYGHATTTPTFIHAAEDGVGMTDLDQQDLCTVQIRLPEPAAHGKGLQAPSGASATAVHQVSSHVDLKDTQPSGETPDRVQPTLPCPVSPGPRRRVVVPRHRQVPGSPLTKHDDGNTSSSRADSTGSEDVLPQGSVVDGVTNITSRSRSSRGTAGQVPAGAMTPDHGQTGRQHHQDAAVDGVAVQSGNASPYSDMSSRLTSALPSSRSTPVVAAGNARLDSASQLAIVARQLQYGGASTQAGPMMQRHPAHTFQHRQQGKLRKVVFSIAQCALYMAGGIVLKDLLDRRYSPSSGRLPRHRVHGLHNVDACGPAEPVVSGHKARILSSHEVGDASDDNASSEDPVD